MSGFTIALRYVKRSPYQALAAISIMTLTFFVAGLIFLVGLTSSTILTYFESRPQITAFFSDNKTTEQIADLQNKLQSTGKVSMIKYISKEEALQIYKDQNAQDPILLEMVTADILPASIEVSATDAKDLSFLADILDTEEGVEDVVYQKDVIDSLISWTSAIRTIGLMLFVFLAVVSLLIILTVTGIRIALRKEEIEILRLVGASGWYIKSPFLMEGMIYGVLGGFISWIVIYILILYATPFLKPIFTGLPITLPPPLIIMLLFLLGNSLGGGLLGVIGSFIAVKRYLK
ncbi:ABC transporter permease [Candidatus Gottesmanbacteria bacterium]|nr:ABC transporter permease [Candidatus Gottesmanbacteria bacterium]